MKKISVKDLCFMAICLSLLIICSKISFEIGPIPLTAQTFCVIMIGLLLKWKKAGIVFLLYILLGLLGLPVFSGGGGFAYVLKPSFGFIIGFYLSSLITGSTVLNNHRWTLYIKGLLGLAVIDVVGLAYMALIMNGYMGLNKDFAYILSVGLTPFIVKDLIVVVVATVLYERISPVFEKSINVGEYRRTEYVRKN